MAQTKPMSKAPAMKPKDVALIAALIAIIFYNHFVDANEMAPTEQTTVKSNRGCRCGPSCQCGPNCRCNRQRHRPNHQRPHRHQAR